MDAEDLLEVWEQHNDRPQFVIEHADALEEHTNTSESIPTDRVYKAREWLDRYRAVVTRQLREAVENSDTPNTDAPEHEGNA